MKLRNVFRAVLALVPAAAATVLLAAPPASAASLQEVTNFGTNPSSLRMFVYVPNNVAPHPAIVVAVHYCHGDGPAFFNGSDFGRLADQYGFIVIFPSVTQASDGCFDVASSATLTHNGGSDSLGIVSMVSYAEQHYNGDASRVYATGVSSGAMMTNVLLGAYPDVFKAGSAFAGVPFGCFAVNPDALRWSTACANGQVTHTPQEWGDIVRAAYPGYTGPRPRMQLWHGTADTTLNYVNFGEEIKQWTNVLGVSQTPTSTDTPQSGWTRTRYANASGTVLVEATSMQGVGHGLPVQAADAIHFFGLDTPVASPSPSTSRTASPSPSVSPSASPSRSASPSPSLSISTSPSVSTGPSASPSPSPTGGGSRSCTASYALSSSWPGGFVSNVTVTAGGAAISGWTVTLTLPTGASVTNSWSGQFSGSSGTIQVTNMSYNGALGAGQSTSFGFQATGTGSGVAVSCTAS